MADEASWRGLWLFTLSITIYNKQKRKMDKDFIWTDDVDCAITVCDKEGKVLFQNKVSRGLFQRDGETMVGKSLMPCHSDHSRGPRRWYTTTATRVSNREIQTD